jgi:hypothetical protein
MRLNHPNIKFLHFLPPEVETLKIKELMGRWQKNIENQGL